VKRPIIAIAAVGTVLGGLAGYWHSYRTVQAAITPAPAAAPSATAAAAVPASDRRMTFAVLPFTAPSGDTEAERLALEARETVRTLLEHSILARVTPRALVDQAVAAPASVRQIGQRLDVHFLLRGNITRTGTGLGLDFTVLDVATEIPLAMRSVPAVGPPHPTQFPRRAIDGALFWLTHAALKQEVARARTKPDASLDVRDLTFRAIIDSSGENPDRPAAYAKGQQSLQRALALAPDDPLALHVTAHLNLCECLRAWAKDTREMERIGEAALERVLAIQPDSLRMLEVRAWMLFRRGRHEDALLVAEEVLARDPERAEALRVRVKALFKLGRIDQAAAAVPALLEAMDHSGTQTDAAAVHFAKGDDAAATLLARKALVRMARDERADPHYGVVALVLVAAESRAGRLDRARAALEDFHALVPQAQTVDTIKAWRLPHAMLPDTPAFWQALRRAGVGG
jgi:tetratricopeptide (TPR) repeat protein/TolB-like protein